VPCPACYCFSVTCERQGRPLSSALTSWLTLAIVAVPASFIFQMCRSALYVRQRQHCERFIALSRNRILLRRSPSRVKAATPAWNLMLATVSASVSDIICLNVHIAVVTLAHSVVPSVKAEPRNVCAVSPPDIASSGFPNVGRERKVVAFLCRAYVLAYAPRCQVPHSSFSMVPVLSDVATSHPLNVFIAFTNRYHLRPSYRHGEARLRPLRN